MFVEVEVSSSNIASPLAYNPDTLTARVKFKNKAGIVTATWDYAGISRDVFDEWCSAPSVGGYCQRQIKGVYTGTKVE